MTAYKLFKLKEVASICGKRKLILLGDDTECDPIIYDKFYNNENNRDQVSAIYIHSIKGKELPPGQSSFNTAADLAILENKEGRLSINQAEKIINKIKAYKKSWELIPDWARCPMDVDVNNLQKIPNGLRMGYQVYLNHIKSYCKERRDALGHYIYEQEEKLKKTKEEEENSEQTTDIEKIYKKCKF